MARLHGISANLNAFLDMIAVSEGTAHLGDDGYNVLVGGTLLADYLDHPRKLVSLPRYKIKSSAAGRYQFLSATWDEMARKLHLVDFSPMNQDRAAIELLRRRRALQAVERGHLAAAIAACRREWASLPDAGYGQREHRFDTLASAYTKAGGLIIPA